MPNLLKTLEYLFQPSQSRVVAKGDEALGRMRTPRPRVRAREGKLAFSALKHTIETDIIALYPADILPFL